MDKRHEKPPWKRIVNSCPFGGCITCDEQAERIEELEKVIEKIRLISERSYKLPVNSVAAMKNLKIINKRAVQSMKG